MHNDRHKVADTVPWGNTCARVCVCVRARACVHVCSVRVSSLAFSPSSAATSASIHSNRTFTTRQCIAFWRSMCLVRPLQNTKVRVFLIVARGTLVWPYCLRPPRLLVSSAIAVVSIICLVCRSYPSDCLHFTRPTCDFVQCHVSDLRLLFLPVCLVVGNCRQFRCGRCAGVTHGNFTFGSVFVRIAVVPVRKRSPLPRSCGSPAETPPLATVA